MLTYAGVGNVNYNIIMVVTTDSDHCDSRRSFS